MGPTWFEGTEKKSSKIYALQNFELEIPVWNLRRAEHQIAIGNGLFPLTILWILNELYRISQVISLLITNWLLPNQIKMS